MFGQNNPIYGQIPQASLPGVTPEMQMVAQEQAKPKGMFGGASIDLSRAIAGYLAGMGNPAGVQALNAMNEQRQRLLEHQQSLEDYNRKRADDQSDWRTQYDYKLAHPDTPAQDEMTRHMLAAGIDPNSPQGKALYAASLDPVVMGPQGPMTRSQMLGGGGQPAPAGITFTPLNPPAAPGGPTPGGSGGFPY